MTRGIAVPAAVPAGAKAAPISRVFQWEKDQRADLRGGPLLSPLVSGEIGEQGVNLLVGELIEVGQQEMLDGLADLGDGMKRRKLVALKRVALKRGDGLGQTGDGRRLEEETEREIELKVFEEAREDLSGEQGMAAEFEEVIQDADLLDGEELRKDGGDDFFFLASRT